MIIIYIRNIQNLLTLRVVPKEFRAKSRRIGTGTVLVLQYQFPDSEYCTVHGVIQTRVEW